MNYVVKVGEYYVKSVNTYIGIIEDIELSKEIMRTFPKKVAEALANKINGTVVEIYKNVETMDGYEDKEE